MPSNSIALDWLMSMQSRGVQPGLERMKRLLEGLGNPEKKLHCLHVAGTNGKGSVCAFAESVLLAAGHHVGLYTSPHLVEFSERIRIGGRNASASELEEGIARLRKATSGWSDGEMPTFFELVTALAFDLFARSGCGVVVLETGLGGRLDATNTAPKIACAITPIGMDHMEWLGETLGKIAREKAGIFRPGIPAVLAPQEPEAAESLEAAAREAGTPCAWITEPLPDQLLPGLSGSHQRRNAALALALIRAAGFDPSGKAIGRGLSEVTWPGRFQRLRGGRLILDGAHNLQAIRQLVETWREEFGGERCFLIFGALSDKDPASLLQVLEPIAREILVVPVCSPRSVDPMDLVRGLRVRHRIFGSLKEALEDVLTPATGSSRSPRCPVLLTGSLFLVGEALALESGGEASLRRQ